MPRVKKSENTKPPPKTKITNDAVVKSPISAKETKTATVGLGLTIDVVDLQGKKTGTVVLPKEVFGLSSNKQLVAQAIRVYFANSNQRKADTKTRGEVRGGGAKPWRQKGTGRARAGSSRSPLWVGGGITFGPRALHSTLTLPKKMKAKALKYALSDKVLTGKIVAISNLEKVEPKTKIIANLLTKLNTKGSILFVTAAKSENLKLASRNIQNVSVNAANQLNAYDVIKNKTILFSKEAITSLSQSK